MAENGRKADLIRTRSNIRTGHKRPSTESSAGQGTLRAASAQAPQGCQNFFGMRGARFWAARAVPAP